jgi:hypothetical protein
MKSLIIKIPYIHIFRFKQPDEFTQEQIDHYLDLCLTSKVIAVKETEIEFDGIQIIKGE